MITFLIVDDSSIMRRKLKEILTEAGYGIAGEAVNGKEAIEKYRELMPDMVTMDISMSVMSGIEAVKGIMEIDGDALIIMVSALSQKKMVFDALKNGASHYILKPIEKKKVLSVIKEVQEEI